MESVEKKGIMKAQKEQPKETPQNAVARCSFEKRRETEMWMICIHKRKTATRGYLRRAEWSRSRRLIESGIDGDHHHRSLYPILNISSSPAANNYTHTPSHSSFES
jgi:hypothetical protein